MPKIFNNAKLKSLIPYFIFAIAIIIVYNLVNDTSTLSNITGNIWNTIKPFYYGFLLAYIINLPFGAFKRLFAKSKIKFIKKIGAILSAVITIILFSSILFAVLYFFIPYIVKSVTTFIANLPVYYQGVLSLINYINNLDLFGIYIDPDIILSTLHEMVRNLNIDNVSSTIKAIFGVSSAVFTGILAFISSIYIVIEKDKFKAFLRRSLTVFASANICETIFQYSGRLNKNFKRYIQVQTIDGLILGAIVTIILFILRSPYAVLLGVMLGVVNYIPYFGSIFGTLFVVIIVAFTQGMTMAAIAALVLLIAQQIDGNIIQPKLMSGSFSLSPFLVIVSITIGGAASGVFGMIVAIPIVAVLVDIFNNVIAYIEKKKANAPLE